MRVENCLLLGLLLIGMEGGAHAASQDEPRLYHLLRGSELTEDCPVCDRASVPMPMTGTFWLRQLDEDPLYTRYEIQDIAFRAISQFGQEYGVKGGGIYRIGGHLAILQDLFLDLEITNGIALTKAPCVNENRTPGVPWPQIQISVSQTNGTLSQVYVLTMIAAPAPVLRSVEADGRTGNVRLEWTEHGREAQVEWATNVAGPYTPISPLTTELSFTHTGALNSRSQSFYRLRQN